MSVGGEFAITLTHRSPTIKYSVKSYRSFRMEMRSCAFKVEVTHPILLATANRWEANSRSRIQVGASRR